MGPFVSLHEIDGTQCGEYKPKGGVAPAYLWRGNTLYVRISETAMRKHSSMEGPFAALITHVPKPRSRGEN